MITIIMLLVKITIATIVDGYYEPSSLGRALHILSYLVLKTKRPPTRITVCVFSRSVVSGSLTLRAVALQTPLSMEFSRQECWSGLPFLTPEDLPCTEEEVQ